MNDIQYLCKFLAGDIYQSVPLKNEGEDPDNEFSPELIEETKPITDANQT